MAQRFQVLIVGDTADVMRFKFLLEEEGVGIWSADKFHKALEIALQDHPDAIMFVLPRYWEDVTEFIKKIRSHTELAETIIFYLGSLIEGEDQILLHRWGVKTLTLGPVPDTEVVRYVMRLLKHAHP